MKALHWLKARDGQVLVALFAWRKAKLIARIKLVALVKRSTIDLEIGPGFQMGKRVVVKIAPRSSIRVRIGPQCNVAEGVMFLFTSGSLWCGEDVQFRRFNVVSVNGDLHLTGGNIFGYGSVIHCAEKVHLGQWSGSGEYASIVDSSHFFTEPDFLISRNTDSAPVIIGANVFICPRASVNRGVTIGDFVIVGPNSVVTKDIGSGMFVSGVPAKPIRHIDLPWENAAKVVDAMLAEAT